MESLIESGAFTDLDTRIILTIQTRLLELQAIKNKFTRGPSGYYTLIKEQVQSIERIRKEQRKMNHHSQKFMLDVEDNLVLDPSHTLDCIEYETIIPRVIHTNVMNRIKSRKSSQRKEALNSSMSLESDDKMYSEIKAKVEVPGEPAIDSCILTPNALKPWHSAASFE